MRYHARAPLPRPPIHRWNRVLWMNQNGYRAVVRSDLTGYERATLTNLTVLMSSVTNALARGAHALSYEELEAAGCGVKSRTVRKHIHKLASLGLLQWFDDGWRTAWHVRPDYARHPLVHPRVLRAFNLSPLKANPMSRPRKDDR